MWCLNAHMHATIAHMTHAHDGPTVQHVGPRCSMFLPMYCMYCCCCWVPYIYVQCLNLADTLSLIHDTATWGCNCHAAGDGRSLGSFWLWSCVECHGWAVADLTEQVVGVVYLITDALLKHHGCCKHIHMLICCCLCISCCLLPYMRIYVCCSSGITNFLPNVPSTTTCRVCCLPRQQLSAIRNISISPDAFSPWPHNIQQMLNWALEPADEEQLLTLMDCGRCDARLWAQQTGLAALSQGTRAMDSADMVGSSSLDDACIPSGTWLAGVAQGGNGSSKKLEQQLPSAEEQPVGTSLLGLVRTLMTHNATSRR